VQIIEELPKSEELLSGSSSRKTSEGVGSVVAQAGKLIVFRILNNSKI
jgi:hypothetical protein